ncbi:conserved hypothetical protein [Pedosphaera parvula Ellin514]|uniref:DUF2382 domain-containing protein n=2 Tax=Pedosphaera TaxID=1032526 RepID=B9XR57_PEDPL|nr:conserved hypothetical protein [Pedosphaera parvula Ellin514]
MNPYDDKKARGTMEGADRGSLKRYIDHDVVDSANNKIGTLECLWSDKTGQPAFLGVKTGWIFGKTHVVPARDAEVNEATSTIRLPFSTDLIKGAPAYDTNWIMDDASERQIYTYYGEERSGLGEKRMETRETRATEVPRFDPELKKEYSGFKEKEAPVLKEKETSVFKEKEAGMEANRIQLHEEELLIGKRQVNVGGVRLRKVVRTETVNKPVELQHEEVIIERVPASEVTPSMAGKEKFFTEQEIFIPLRREEAVIETKDHVREEIRARKVQKVETTQVSGTVRREDVNVEKEGQDVKITQGAGKDQLK